MLLTNSFAGTEGPEDAEACSKWTRPPPPDLNTAKDNVVFQQIDVDHYIGIRADYCTTNLTLKKQIIQSINI
jgi:hypothetical protein